MASARFTGGGSLDGEVWEYCGSDLPPVTASRERRTAARSWYVLGGDGVYRFTGTGKEGRAMGKIAQQFADAARRDREAIEAAGRPVGCGRCGLTLGSPGAYQLHLDDFGSGPVCLPPEMTLLELVDGVWCTPGSDATLR